MKRYGWFIVAIIALAFMAQGCGTVQKAKKISGQESEITRLRNQLDEFEREKDAEIEQLLAEKAKKDEKLSDLERAKSDLERSLKKEIGDYKAKLEMTERGLVINFLAEIFFNSGKDAIKPEGESALKKVAEVLNASVAKSPIAVEGHTDNEPIMHSGWKSNWELSTARALSVVHYFIDKCDVKPERLSAAGYAEYKPITSNKTAEERKKNRRVEIVILPSLMKTVKQKN